MEPFYDGELVRQHHSGPNWRISHEEGVRYRLQRRSVAPEGTPPANILCCPSPYVSGDGHCEIFRRDQSFWIIDLGSFNGTYLNGNKLAENVESPLGFGDIIGLGLNHLEEDGYELSVEDESSWIFKFEMATIQIGNAESEP